MSSVSDVATGLSYGTSIGSTDYWLLQLMDKIDSSQWAAIGVIGSLVFGLLTCLINLYFKIKDNNRKEAQLNGSQE